MTIEELKREESLKRIDFRQWNEIADTQARITRFLEGDDYASQLSFEVSMALGAEMARATSDKAKEWEVAESAYTRALVAEEEARELASSAIAAGSVVPV